MPDYSLFPSLELELGQLRINDPQTLGPLPDYGTPETLQRISDLYAELGRIKSENPIARSRGAMKTSEDFMLPSVRRAISPKIQVSDLEPIQFDVGRERPERYEQSKYFKDIGFLPGQDNEELYSKYQTNWEKLTNGIAGAWDIAKFQFVDQLKGWGRLVDSIFSTDLNKLYDQDDMAQVNAELEDIMNRNAVFQGQSDRDSVFTMANIGNFIQQSGFTLGALAEIAAEELVLSLVTAGTGGIAGAAQAARTAQLLGTTFQRLARLEEIGMNASRARKAFEKIARYTPFTHTAQTLLKGAREGENVGNFALRGFGSFYRDIREANAAFTEARAETAGTYAQLKEDLLNDLYDSGKSVTREEIDRIDRTAREAADANFWTNAIIIGASNRIQFDNYFRGMRGPFAELGKISENAKGYFKRTTIPFKEGFYRTLKAEAIPKFFSYFKNNVTEALQENLQSASDIAIRAYYRANYDNPGSKLLKDAINEGLSSQLTTEGARTFTQGFLTAFITGPFTGGISSIYRRISTPASQRRAQRQTLANQIAQLNGFFTQSEGKNAGIQASIAGAMGKAMQEGNQKDFQDLKDESIRHLARTAIETNKVDSLFYRLASISRGMSDKEFKEAFGIDAGEANRKLAAEYISGLRDRVRDIQKIKEDLDEKFPNPFVPRKGMTEEQMDSLRANNLVFEEAKWHFAYMRDAHGRVLSRQKSVIQDIKDDLKDVAYSTLYNIADPKDVRAEIKVLEGEIAVAPIGERQKKEKIRNLLQALLPGLEKGEVDQKTFEEYLNYVQKTENRPQIPEEKLKDNFKRIQDFYKLKQDEQNLFKNINYLVDPENFTDFFERHLKADPLTKAADMIKEELKKIQDEHPDVDVTDSPDGVSISPKPNAQASEEELRQVAEKAKKAINTALGVKEATPDAIKQRLQDIYNKLEQTGQIDDQDRAFIDLESTQEQAKDDASLIKIKQLLAQQGPPQPEGEEQEDKADKEAHEEQQADRSAYPYYEGSERIPDKVFYRGDVKTVIQEIRDKGQKRNQNGDVEAEGGYSYVRGQVARHFKDTPALFNRFEFVLMKDNPIFYEHAEDIPKEIQDELGIFDKNSPYRLFLKDKRTTNHPAIFIRDKQTKEFMYFNPYEAPAITGPQRGVIIALTIDYESSGLKKDGSEVLKFLDTQPNGQYVVDFNNVNVSLGAFYENKGRLRNLETFTEGIQPSGTRSIEVAKGEKFIPWIDEANLRNGGLYIRQGNLNDLKLVPSRLSEMRLGDNPYDIRPLFNRDFTQEEAERLVKELRKIIYTGPFLPQNRPYERIAVSFEPAEPGRFRLKLILENPTPETAVLDPRLFIWRDSGLNTQTILAYLLEGRHMNIDEELQADIDVPVIDNQELTFVTLPYLEFLGKNTFTNKARVVHPNGQIDIHPVNQFFVFTGLADTIKTKPQEKKEAAEAAGPLTGEAPAGPAGELIKKLKEQEGDIEAKKEEKLSAEDLLKKLRGEEGKFDTENFDDKLTKLKDGIQRALIDNEELQFIKDRFGDHVLNVMAYAANSNYWGYWQNGVITLYKDAQKGVGYHEAWHHFSQMFLTEKEKEALYKEAREIAAATGDQMKGITFSDKFIEEELADAFSEYAQSGGTLEVASLVRRNIFQKIWDFLVRLFTGKKTLSDYFKDLYQGRLESYRPSINNARWGRLNYGFSTYEGGRRVELFDAKEYAAAKDFFHVMMHRAFSNEGPDYNLKNIGINMSTLVGLRSNKKLHARDLQNVFLATKNQIDQYIRDNAAAINNNPAAISILNRVITHRKEFFDHIMMNFQMESNIEDVVEQEEIDSEQIPTKQVEGEEAVNEAEGEPVIEQEKQQYSDRISDFQDKGILAAISKQMRNFILTIPKADPVYENGIITRVNEYRNEYGLPEVCDFNKVINVLAEELQGLNRDDQILARLNSPELLQRLPEVHFIRQALADVTGVPGFFATQTIISIFRDFNRFYTPVYSLVEKIGDEQIDAFVEQTRGTTNKIRREWHDNFLNSGYVIADERDEPYLNPVVIEANKALTAKGQDGRAELLRRLGIEFSPRTMNTREFRDLMLSQNYSYFINSLDRRLKAGQKITNLLRQMTGSFQEADGAVISGQGTFINDALRIEAKFSDRIPSNMFITAKGTKKYALMLPNQLNIVGNTLRSATTTADLSEPHLRYLIDPENYFLRNSLVMRSLFDSKGLKTKSNFEFIDYNSVSLDIFGKKINKQTLDLTEREKLIVNLKTLFGQGHIDIMRTGTAESFYSYALPEYYHEFRIGDKVNSLISYTIPFSPKTFYHQGKPTITFQRAFDEYFMGLLEDELAVMKFSNIPGSQGEKFKDWGVFDGIFSKELKGDIQSALEKVTRPDQIRGRMAPLQERVSKEVMDYLRDRAANFLEYANENGVSPDPSGNSPEILGRNVRKLGVSWRETAFLFTLNTFVLNVEFSRIISGTPQQYKDFHKRFKAVTSPGNNSNVGNVVKSLLRATFKQSDSNHTGTMAGALGKKFDENIHLFKADVTTNDSAPLDQETQESWGKFGEVAGKQDEMKGIIDVYNDPEKIINDGEAHMNLDAYRRFRIQVGNWSFDTDEKEYQKEVAKWRIRKGKFQNEDEKKALQSLIDRFSDQTYSTFPVMKLHYNGPIDRRGIPVIVQHKYAVAPIIPSVYEDSALDAMSDYMLENGIDYITPVSGSKVYTPDPFQLWADPKTREDFNVQIGPRDPMPLFAAYLKEQIKTDGSFTTESNWSIQLRSLFLSNEFDDGQASPAVQKLFENYKRSVENIIELEKQELYHEFGIREEGDQVRIANAKSLVETIQRQALIQNLNSNVKQAVGYDPITGGFTTPLEIVTNRQPIVDLINGMIFRKLVRVKINGDMLIQVSSTGTRRKGESELATYKPRFNKKGEYVGFEPAEAKIAFAPRFRSLLNLTHPDGKKIKTRERLNEALLDEKWRNEHFKETTFVANRIPLQGPNSIEFLRVREFLPEIFGPCIIVNKEIVTKTGSDFDHDKLHTLFPSYDVNGKVLEEDSKPTYEKALEKLLSLQRRDDSVANLIQTIFDEDQTEEEIDLQVDTQPMSEENRRIIRNYLYAKRELKGYYTNEAIRSYAKALQISPEMFLQLIRPNTDSTVKGLAIDMGIRAKDEGFTEKGVQVYKNTEIYDWVNNQIVMRQNKLGKKHLAIFAVLNRVLQNFQKVGLHFNPTFLHRFYRYQGSRRIPTTTELVTTPYLLSEEERKQYAPGGLVKVGSTTFANGKTKQDIISELMNATVDIEKNPYYTGLGINQYNAGVAAILIAENVPLERISAFLRQPILNEYYKLQSIQPYFEVKRKNERGVEESKAFPASNKNAITLLGLKRKDKKGNVVDANTPGLEVEIQRLNNNELNEDYSKIFDYNSLLENVGKTQWKTKSQRIIFGHFLALNRLQRVYIKLQQIITVDSKKIASPIGAQAYLDSIDEVINSKLVSREDINKIRQDGYTAPFGMAQEIKDIFRIFMPVGFSDTFVNEIATYLRNEDLFLSKDDRLKLERTLANDYMIYVVLEKGEYNGENFRDYINKKISRKVSPETLARQLTQMKRGKFEPVFRFFGVAGKMHENISKRNQNIHSIQLDRFADNSTEAQDVMINEWVKLINFTGTEVPGVKFTPEEAQQVRETFKNAALVALGQSGFNKSWFYMTDILPLSEVQPMIKRALQTYQEEIRNNPEYEKDFVKAFIQEFPSENKQNFDLRITKPPANPEPYRGKYLNRPFKKPVQKYVYTGPRFVERKDIITREEAQENRRNLYLFGDNLLRKGLGGQAKELRGEPNSMGIATKRSPSNDNSAFFSDAKPEFKQAITDDVNKVIKEWDTGKYDMIVVPQIGVGLAKLPTKAPQTYQHLLNEIQRLKAHVEGKQPPPEAAPPTTPVEPPPPPPKAPSGAAPVVEVPQSKPGEIVFQEHNLYGYQSRTVKNASADVTIAIAVDFNSAGEKLTKTSVLNQKKVYIPVDVSGSLIVTNSMISEIENKIPPKAGTEGISLNIAGNGIYTMKGKYTQEQVDKFTYDLIKRLVDHPFIKINSIRTGGQTGFDEAGAKAGRALGIPTTILAPKGWLFRGITGRDTADEKAFKARFEIKQAPPAAPSPAPEGGSAIEIYSQLGNKTQSENVRIERWDNLKNQKEAFTRVYGSVVHIISTRIPNTNEHFGNPFSSDPRGKMQGLIKTDSVKESVQNYIDWLVTDKFKDVKPEQREWILSKITTGELKGKPILYYKELGEPSHATALDYLINKYDWKLDNEIDSVLEEKDQGC